ncbi:MAG: hypothetical protein AB7F21_10995 [Desulfuromonadales bacterium]
MTKRSVLCLLSGIVWLLTVSAPLAAELATDEAVLSPAAAIEALLGEDYIYDVSFLWFDQLAEGRIRLERAESPHTYRAMLEAKTLGVAAWLTGDRVQRYVSVMQATDDGRLHSQVYESHILKKKKGKINNRIKRYTFDSENRTILYQKFNGDKKVSEEVIAWNHEEWPDDFLTAFYNFRLGNSGPLVPGARYRIPTFKKEGPTDILIEILSEKARPSKAFFPAGGHLVKVILDPDVFETAGGDVFMWMDASGRPVKGLVEKVIGLGDVKGTMRQ